MKAEELKKLGRIIIHETEEQVQQITYDIMSYIENKIRRIKQIKEEIKKTQEEIKKTQKEIKKTQKKIKKAEISYKESIRQFNRFSTTPEYMQDIDILKQDLQNRANFIAQLQISLSRNQQYLDHLSSLIGQPQIALLRNQQYLDNFLNLLGDQIDKLGIALYHVDEERLANFHKNLLVFMVHSLDKQGNNLLMQLTDLPIVGDQFIRLSKGIIEALLRFQNITEGRDLYHINNNGDTPLLLAIKKDAYVLVDLYINTNADFLLPNKDGKDAIELLQQKASQTNGDEQQDLIQLVALLKFHIMSYVNKPLPTYLSTNGKNLLMICIEKGWYDCYQKLKETANIKTLYAEKDNDGKNFLMIAVTKGDFVIAKDLLQLNIPHQLLIYDNNNQNAFLLAIMFEHYDIVNYIASLYYHIFSLRKLDPAGHLMLSVIRNDLQLTKSLLYNDATDTSVLLYALHLAVICKCHDIVIYITDITTNFSKDILTQCNPISQKTCLDIAYDIEDNRMKHILFKSMIEGGVFLDFIKNNDRVRAALFSFQIEGAMNFFQYMTSSTTLQASQDHSTIFFSTQLSNIERISEFFVQYIQDNDNFRIEEDISISF